MLELLLVISLFCVASTLLLANVSFLSRFIVRSEIDKLYTLCVYHQHRAMVTNQKQTITFDLQKNTYTGNNIVTMLPKHAKFGVRPGAKGPPSSPKKEIQKPITFADNCITFHPNGIISPGTVYFIDNSQACYALSSPISQFSFLRKYQYDGTWHMISH